MRPAEETIVTMPRTRLDEFAPIYQFRELHQIPVNATPERVYDATLQVTAAEIPLFRTLIWIRRGGTKGPGSELIRQMWLRAIKVRAEARDRLPIRSMCSATLIIGDAPVSNEPPWQAYFLVSGRRRRAGPSYR